MTLGSSSPVTASPIETCTTAKARRSGATASPATRRRTPWTRPARFATASPGRCGKPPTSTTGSAGARPGVRFLALAVLALALAGTATASEVKPTPAELESELVCPVCETTLDTSDAPAARRIKAYIRSGSPPETRRARSRRSSSTSSGRPCSRSRRGRDSTGLPGCFRLRDSPLGRSSSARSPGTGAAAATTRRLPRMGSSRSIPSSNGASTPSSPASNECHVGPGRLRRRVRLLPRTVRAAARSGLSLRRVVGRRPSGWANPALPGASSSRACRLSPGS